MHSACSLRSLVLGSRLIAPSLNSLVLWEVGRSFPEESWSSPDVHRSFPQHLNTSTPQQPPPPHPTTKTSELKPSVSLKMQISVVITRDWGDVLDYMLPGCYCCHRIVAAINHWSAIQCCHRSMTYSDFN